MNFRCVGPDFREHKKRSARVVACPFCPLRRSTKKRQPIAGCPFLSVLTRRLLQVPPRLPPV